MHCPTRRLFGLAGILAAMIDPIAAQVGTSPPSDLSARVQQLACAPALAWGEPETPIRLIGSEEGVFQRSYGPGDAIVLDAGLDRELQVGREFFVRRLITPMAHRGAGGRVPRLRHTAGWIRIVAVEQHAAVATVVHACDSLDQGDYLEPFTAPPVPTMAEPGRADYSGAGTILFGEDGATIVGQGGYFVFSRGTADGVKLGQRLTLFRDSFGSGGPVTELGDAFVVAVAPDSATALVLALRDAAYAGDLVAVHR